MARRLARRVAWGAVAIWVVTALGVAALLAWERRAALERGVRTSEAFALVLEESAARTLEAVDATLAGVAEALRLEPDLPPNDPGFQAALERRLQALRPYARSIYVVGPDGTVLHDTNHPNVPSVNLSDRPYFGRHRDDPALVRSVSDPVESRSGRGWFFAVTHRLGASGRFEGIAVAAVQPQYFETLFQRMGLERLDLITLYHRDGVLVARYPDDGSYIGQSFAEYPLFTTHLPARAAGSYITDSGLLSYERIVSYRAVENAPMVVALARSTRSVLAGWRRAAISAALAMAGLAVLLGALVVQFRRQQEMQERGRQRLVQAQKLEALGHLTGGIAHDFGNLLGIIATNLHLLERRPLDDASREAVALAKRAAAHGTDLTERLRSFAKRRPLHVASADLNARLREASGLLRQAAGSEIDVELALARPLSSCLLDETELEVALVNLVANAKDAMEGKGRIVLRTSESRDWVCVSVADTGSGMPEEVLSRVPEPYYTTKGEAGTGLGLAQVYGFMQQIGGDVRIHSRPGAGTTVELLFPKARIPRDGGLRRA